MRLMLKQISTDNEPGSRKLKVMLMLSEKQEMHLMTSKVIHQLQELLRINNINNSRVNSMPWNKKEIDSRENSTDSKKSSRPRETSKPPTSKPEERPLPVKRKSVPLKPKQEPPKTELEIERELRKTKNKLKRTSMSGHNKSRSTMSR
jgi:hypothetical protein